VHDDDSEDDGEVDAEVNGYYESTVWRLPVRASTILAQLENLASIAAGPHKRFLYSSNKRHEGTSHQSSAGGPPHCNTTGK